MGFSLGKSHSKELGLQGNCPSNVLLCCGSLTCLKMLLWGEMVKVCDQYTCEHVKEKTNHYCGQNRCKRVKHFSRGFVTDGGLKGTEIPTNRKKVDCPSTR